MPTFAPPSPTEIANLALAEVGQNPISDIDDNTSNAAKLCARNFWQAVAKVGREHNWNCLQRRKPLTQLALPNSSSTDSTSFGWSCGQPTSWPPYWLANTPYAGGDLVTYGEAVYYCLQAYTSSENFINDLTAGAWAQLYNPATGNPGGPGGANGYEWNFGYALPQDYLLLTELNGNSCLAGRGVGDLYEIFVYQTDNSDGSESNVRALFCNAPYANVKYTALIQDTSILDPQFVDAVAVFLASKISTPLRADDGKMAAILRQRYTREVLPGAMLKDSGERKGYRYDPTRESNFLRSRYGSTNG